MDNIVEFISLHASKAHWFIFISLLLAGCNLPISIDVVMILSAVLAASVVPEHKFLIYFSVLFGCQFSAWIAYSIGRLIGDKLPSMRFFSKLLPPKKIEEIQSFYAKYGIWTFVIGRFIPFGVRNCIFTTSGISKMPFRVFAIRDAVACLTWTTTVFSTFYLIGQNFDTLWNHVKTFNIIIFSAFSVTVIGVFWYKLKKRKRLESSDKTP